jgi:N-acetylglucosaminyldiphosphoundecaprenol N-acetyl-beta-D-mannosaminyltransferase
VNFLDIWLNILYFLFIKNAVNFERNTNLIKKMKILDIEINNFSRTELTKIFNNILEKTDFKRIATVNPEFLVEANSNEKFKKNLKKADYKINDGTGISIMGRIFYKTKIIKIPGVEVAEILIKLAAEKSKKVFLLGGFNVAEKSAQKWQKEFPNLVIKGTDGSPNSLAEEIIEFSPDIIMVAFGAPAQEFWIEKYSAKIPSLKIAIGVGGTFDFWAGKIKRAPRFLRKLGLEWLWRFSCEPIKRSKRIYKALIVFPILMVLGRGK